MCCMQTFKNYFIFYGCGEHNTLIKKTILKICLDLGDRISFPVKLLRLKVNIIPLKLSKVI